MLLDGFLIFFISFKFVCSLSRADPEKTAVQSSRKQPECGGGGQTPAAAGLLALDTLEEELWIILLVVYIWVGMLTGQNAL